MSQSEQPDSLQEQTASANGDTGGGVLGTHVQDVNGPVSTGDGEAVDLRESQGAVYKPSGDVRQHFGDVITNILFGNVDAERAHRNRENRKAMLQKVRHAWIEGVLEQSLYQVARIDLGLAEQPDAVPHPWDMLVQEQGRPPRELPPGTRMGQVFDQLGGALLILGAPGSGKTTLLLELADELLDRAERDDGHRIPVVFNLSSWAVKRKPLVDWLVDELNERYDVPRKMGQAWVEGEQILPLLDGLDEVAREHREGCAEAINAFRRDHGLVPLAVCSRVEEYETLAARLRMSGAVLVQSMTGEQVDAYLARAGQPLAGVRDALQADATLYELFDTPLMLSIAALAYQDAPARVMQVVGPAEGRREHLFAAYIDAMFSRRGKEGTYERPQTERWLKWLAGQMVAHRQTVFYLERMQPDWLPRRWQRLLVTLGVGSAIGLIVGLVFGLVVELWWKLDFEMGLDLGLCVGLWFWWVFFMLGGFGKSILPVETLSWSWPRARRAVGLALGGGLFLGLLFGLLLGLSDARFLGAMPVVMLLLGLGFGLIWGLGVGLVTGDLDIRTRPNQGIRRSAQNGLLVGSVVGLIFGSVAALLIGLFAGLGLGVGLVFRLDIMLFVGLGFGLFFGLRFGGKVCLQHLALRLLLWRNSFAPLSYVRFLDYAAERVILRKVGGGYIFVHRLLMEHFAAQWEADG